MLWSMEETASKNDLRKYDKNRKISIGLRNELHDWLFARLSLLWKLL